MHTDGLQSVKALSPSHSSIFVHQVHTRPSAFPSSASLAVTGEPGGFAPPAPLKILIPGFSSSLSSPYTLHLSSNQPTDWLTRSLSCPLAEGVRKGEGRPRSGSAACHFIVLGRRGSFSSSLSHPHSFPRHCSAPAPPLSPV